MMTHLKAFPVQLAPLIDRSSIDCSSSPLLLKANQPATVTVRVSGAPAPRVSWYLGSVLLQGGGVGVRLKGSRQPVYRHCVVLDGIEGVEQCTLTVTATNELGRDTWTINIKTYKVLSGLSADGATTTLCDRRQTAADSLSSLVQQATCSDQDLAQWHAQMVERSRMRSIDDIIDDWVDNDTSNNNNNDKTMDSSLTQQHIATTTTTTTAIPRHPLPPATAAPDDVLWSLFGLKLSRLCHLLLSSDVITPHDRCHANNKPALPPKPSALRQHVTQVGGPTPPLSRSGRGVGMATAKPPIGRKPPLSGQKRVCSRTISRPDQEHLVAAPSTSCTSATSATREEHLEQHSPVQSHQPAAAAAAGLVVGQGAVVTVNTSCQQQHSDDDVVANTGPLHCSTVTTTTTAPSDTVLPGNTTTPRRAVNIITTTTTTNTVRGRDRIKACRSEEVLVPSSLSRDIHSTDHPRCCSASPSPRSSHGHSADVTCPRSPGAGPSSTTPGMSRRTLSKEWQVVTWTTQEEEMSVVQTAAGSSRHTGSPLCSVRPHTATTQQQSNSQQLDRLIDSLLHLVDTTT